MLSPIRSLDEEGASAILLPFMSLTSSTVRSMLLCSFLSVGGFAACGDDEVAGQGGAGGGTTSDGSSTASASASTASSSTGSTASGPVGSGGAAGSGGDGGAGGATQGSGGKAGSGGAGSGGSEPACAEQPPPYALGELSDDACAALAADEQAPALHVEYMGEPTEVLEYDGTIAIDMAFTYLLALPLEEIGSFTLTESRCQLLAGDLQESCSEGEVDLSTVEQACSLRYSGRFGIDPSNVHEGINNFDFTMTLRTGCAVVSDTFTLVVDYQPNG